MGDWEEQLNSILGDPAQMSRIADLARSLMGGEEDAPPPAPVGNEIAALAKAAMGGRDDTRELLEAMKPWLSEKRRAKLDRAAKLARMAKLAQLAMAEGDAGDV